MRTHYLYHYPDQSRLLGQLNALRIVLPFQRGDIIDLVPCFSSECMVLSRYGGASFRKLDHLVVPNCFLDLQAD